MFNNGKTYLQNFEIGIERKRLTAHLADLFFSDYASYIPRPIEGPVTIGLLCNNLFFLYLSKYLAGDPMIYENLNPGINTRHFSMNSL
jgi:hypothetical protein